MVYGWGNHRTKTGWMFGVWALDAVELDLASGERFTIGTNDPGELLSALETRASVVRER